MCTIKINTVCIGNERKLLFTFSKFDVIYNVFLITLVILMGCFNHWFLSNFYSGLSKLQFKIILIRSALVTMMCVTTIFLFCVKQKKFISLIINILSMQRSLAGFDKEISSDESKSLLRKIIYFFTLNALTLILPFTMMHQYSYIRIFNYIIYCFKVTVISYLLVQYIIIVMFINYFCRIINKNFHKILCISNVLVEEKTFTFSRLHEFYFTLRELVEKVSDFYSFLLFFSISFLFGNLLFYSFHLALLFSKEQS